MMHATDAAARIIVPGVSAGHGAHEGPQTQAEIDQARAARHQRQQQKTTGKRRARPSGGVADVPKAGKKSHKDGTAKTGDIASIALVHTGRVLLTRETRSGKTLLNLPGGKGESGETPGQTAAREAHEETGKQLSQRTRAAIAGLINWVESGAGQGLVGVLHLADDDPDGAVDARFDRAAANAQRGSKTVQEGLEWHPLADVRSDQWRRNCMHFPGQHRAAAVMRVIGWAGTTNPSVDGAGSPSGMGGINPDVGSCAPDEQIDTSREASLVTNDDLADADDGSDTRSCGICGHGAYAGMFRHCDKCNEAYHDGCARVPAAAEEWLCVRCR